MNKFTSRAVIIAAVMITSTAAHAGDYTDMVEAQNACAIEGRMAAEAFTSDTIFGWDYGQIVSGGPNGEVPMKDRPQFFSIYTNARRASISTAQAAHMDAWARCMDRQKKL